MINSMTGYGKGTAGNDKFSAEVEVKSVNSRYLDISLRLPSSLMNKEYELREFIKNKISRGKLSVNIQLKSVENDNGFSSLDKDKLKKYLNMLKEIRKAAKITEKVKIEHIISNKDLLEANKAEYAEEEFELIKKALDTAISDLKKMKRNEGAELQKDLEKRIKAIEDKLTVIEQESSVSVTEYFNKLKDRIKILIEDVTVYSERLELELALIADRAEINEECVRLRSHLKFFLESLNKDDEPGRKLNFLCQEMNRESNTISSKSISTVITHNSVLIKEEIEKIREQIQNIE
ncbi:MAG: YicC/YloC family endoribonuclease [Ignavibacteriaceae bacterium]